MLKRDFFILALKEQKFKFRSWVFSVFSMTKNPSESMEAYDIRINNNQYEFFDPKTESFIVIDDAVSDKPLFNHKDPIEVSNSDVPNIAIDKGMIKTTYGNVFFNYLALVYAFNTKIPFQTGKVSIKKIEEIIAYNLTDNPKDKNEARDPKKIYVDEYLRFTQAVYYMMVFSQLFVPGGGEKAITYSPEILKLKAELLEKYKDKLNDPVTVAKIEAELIKLDKEFLKGDPDAEGFLFSDKSINIVRKKMFLMLGLEAGVDTNEESETVVKSLDEGWDVSKFAALNNTVRSGSYNRGAQTMLGGESVKWLLRASSNLAITQDDCETDIGLTIRVSENKKEFILSRYVIENGQSILITKDNIDQYINKDIVLRSPMFCKLDNTDFCKKCCGEKLTTHETGLSMAVSEYGSEFLGIFMSMMHSTGISLQRLKFKELLK